MPDRSFDCIVFNDVLEHLADPQSALGAARGSLTAIGSVIASVPNVRHFTVTVPLVLYGRWTYRDRGILDRTHLRFFTRSSLIGLFDASGYLVDRVEAIRLTRRKGKVARVLHLLGHRATEFLAEQYVISAMPRAPSPSR